MRKRNREHISAYGRLLDKDQLCSYLNMGLGRALKFADQAGAKRKFGKSALYDRNVLDAALDKIGGQYNAEDQQ